jgi:hypothetical protein
MWRILLMLFAIPILFAGFFVYADEDKESLAIVEIMFNPSGSDTKREWIEVRNTGSEDVELKEWKLVENGDEPHSIKDCSENVLGSGDRAVIADSKDTFLDERDNFDGIVCDSSFKLKNTGEVLSLWDPEKEEHSVINYGEYNVDEGHALEQCTDGDWQRSALIGGSPGEKNCQKPKVYKDMRITELFPNPEESPESKHEFIEVYNFGDKEVDFDLGWKVRKEYEKSDGKKVEQEKDLSGAVNEGKYALLDTIPSLNNDEKLVLITLVAPDGEDVGGVEYGEAPSGQSWALNGKTWQWTPIITPGKPNKFPEAAPDAKVQISEILPNPEGDADGEFIEFYNAGDETVELQFWSIQDKGGNAYIFSDALSIQAGAYNFVMREKFGFAINDSDEELFLLDPLGNVIDTLSFESSNEGVSLGREGKEWRACRRPTPGKENIFNTRPKTRDTDIPEDVYKNVYAYFSVKTKDGDNDTVKVRWDFGDGHRSYQQETKHKYDKKGKYTVTLRLDDGRESIEKTYVLEVKKFPKRKVRIVGIMPNPVGKDSDNEYIILKNEDKRSVNLEGWSIATGNDPEKLVNHPIVEKWKIKKGEEKTMTREESKFSLGNKTLFVELRYPNGKVADEVSFELEKSVEEGMLYVRRDAGWVWKQTRVGDTISGRGESVNSEEEIELQIVHIPIEFIGKVTVRGRLLPVTLSSWNGEPSVLGVQTKRLDRAGKRYVFTYAVAEDHYVKSFLRKMKKKIRGV